MNTTRLLTTLIAIIIVLAGIQWYMNSRPDAYFNQYGVTASSTPLADIKAETGSKQVAPVVSVPTPAAPVSTAKTNTTSSTNKNFMHTITIETNKGTIVFETYDADAPNTVKNFITLAEKGFYDNLIFHRVIKNFMIQGGDPTGTGMGGPGYKFADELDQNTPSSKAGYVRGTVAMANSGPNTNGSQFFIMHKDTPLPHNYTIFGRVISGLDIVDAIAAVQTGGDSNGNKPLENVVMKKVTVVTK